MSTSALIRLLRKLGVMRPDLSRVLVRAHSRKWRNRVESERSGQALLSAVRLCSRRGQRRSCSGLWAPGLHGVRKDGGTGCVTRAPAIF